LLLPIWTELPRSYADSVALALDALARAGFDVEVGDSTASGNVRVGIKSVPTALASRRELDWAGMLRATASELAEPGEHGDSAGIDRALHDVLATASCHTAVRKGDRLEASEISALLRALTVLTAPDGAALPARRITVSTSGLVPAIERYARDGMKTGLALSLNATTDDVRDRLIPSNRRYRIRGVLDACRHWADTTGGRLTVEYVLLRGVNDSTEDARRLGDLLEHVPCKVNLIPFNPIPSASFARPEPARVAAFQKILYDARRVATVRKTKGSDVAAACGQLQANYAGTTRSETAAGSVAR
ncbi:MAG: hypothetical protein ABGY41_00740, partial [Candidatus Poribacteria bacterium]